MSLLEGGLDHKLVYPIANPYGVRLQECARLPLEGATDVVVNESGDTAYIAGRGALAIVDVTQPQRPVMLGQLHGLGVGRQVEVQHGLAAVTCRPDGLFLCEVSDPRHPRLLCHYDTVELATGVCLAGDLCLVACRHFGIEIIDISDPQRPVHVSNVLAGEAQSVFVDGATMYVGAWMQREVQLFDIADPSTPRLVSICPLDGFGDGVYVRDGLCFAATGHHARRLTNRRKYLQYDFVTEQMLHDGFGGGHGLEIFDVADTGNPRLLSRIKTPPLFMGGNDLWDVIVSGQHAFLADTYNGVFVINVSNPQGPYFEGYRRLDLLDAGQYQREPAIQQLCNPVGGLAVIEEHILAVSAFSGLHVLAAPAGATTPRQPLPTGISQRKPKQVPAAAVFHPGGQVHGLAFVGQSAVVAAGDEGLYVLDDDRALTVKEHVPTEGFAFDVKTDGHLVYSAEGTAGLSIRRLEAGRLAEMSRFTDCVTHGAVRQVVLLPGTDLVAAHLGVGQVAFIDVSSPEAPVCRAVSAVGGMMYYKSIIDGLYRDRYAAVAPLAPSFVWYDVQDPTHPVKVCVGCERQICTIEEGIALGKEGVFTIFRGKYSFSQDIARIPTESAMLAVFDRTKGHAAREVYLSGRPTLIGDTLFLLNRQAGLVTMLDVSDPYCPVLTKMLTLDGHPEGVVPHGDAFWVCCGHGGLQRIAL